MTRRVRCALAAQHTVLAGDRRRGSPASHSTWERMWNPTRSLIVATLSTQGQLGRADRLGRRLADAERRRELGSTVDCVCWTGWHRSPNRPGRDRLRRYECSDWGRASELPLPEGFPLRARLTRLWSCRDPRSLATMTDERVELPRSNH